MATLEKIRNKAGLLVTVVGVALFAFIIGDLLNSGTSLMSKNQNNVIVVDGAVIGYQEYITLENDVVEEYKGRLQTSNLNEVYMNSIRQMLYEEIVVDKLLEPRFKSLGMTVTTQEMTDMVEGENISQLLYQSQEFINPETGMFDRNSVRMFLYNLNNIDQIPQEYAEYRAQLMEAKNRWMFLEKNIKRNRIGEKYITLLSSAITANSLEARDEYNNSAVSADVLYVMESFANLADSTIAVSKSEIEKLYNERKESFRQEETCVIDYIAIDIVPSDDDYKLVSEEMDAISQEMITTENITALTNEKSERKYVNAFASINQYSSDLDALGFISNAEVGDVSEVIFKDMQYRVMKLVDKTEAADSVYISQLPIAPRATEAETKAFADSVLNEIKGGADFAEMILTHGAGQLEDSWLTETTTLQVYNEDFKKAIFSLPKGQSGCVKLSNGYYMIVRVNDLTKNVPKYKIADIVYKVIPSSKTRDILYYSLNHFIAINNSAEKMAEAAQESGFSLEPNTRILPTDMQVGYNISGARNVVRWAFNDGKKGDISEIFTCDEKFVVAAHKGRIPKGYQSLESLTPQLKSEIAAKKKGEEIAANLKSKNHSSIEGYAVGMDAIIDSVKFVTMNTPRITNIGIEPKLNAYFTHTPLNKVSEPVVGNYGVYVFEVINRTEEEDTYDEYTQKQMLNSNNTYKISSLAIRHMQQNAKIEDNRIRFF
jgi:PPIC-type PPIASE domain.